MEPIIALIRRSFGNAHGRSAAGQFRKVDRMTESETVELLAVIHEHQGGNLALLAEMHATFKVMHLMLGKMELMLEVYERRISALEDLIHIRPRSH